MIGFKVEGQFIDLKPDTSIELSLQNPIFAEDEDVIPGSYTIPFDLPITGLNSSILGSPEVVENYSKFKTRLKAQLFINNTPWLKGEIRIRTVTKEKYTVNFLTGLTTIKEDFKDKDISELATDAFVIDTGTTVKSFYFQSKVGYTGMKRIIVNGNTYEAAQWITIEQDINANDPEASAIYYTEGWPGGTDNDQPGGEFLLVGSSTASTDPYRPISVDVPEDDRVNINMIVSLSYFEDLAAWLNNYLSPTPPNNIIRFPLVINDGLHPQEIKGRPGAKEVKNGLNVRYPFINNTSGGVFEKNYVDVNGYKSYNVNSISPFVLLRYIFEKIEDYGEIKLEGDFFDDPDIQNLLFFSSNSLDLPLDFIGDTQLLFWKREFAVKYFVPEMQISELFKELQKMFCLSIIFDSKNSKLEFSFRKDIIENKTYIDITGKAEEYEDLDNNPISGLTLRGKQDQDDDNISVYSPENDPNKPYVIGLGTEIFETQFTGVPDFINSDYSSTKPTRIPKITKEAEGDTRRLVFYRGLGTRNGNTFATASIEADNISLSWHGEKGLYEKFWKSWARFLQRRAPVPRQVRFTVADLLNLDFKRKYRIDRVNYLIKSLSVSINMKGVKASKVTFYKT